MSLGANQMIIRAREQACTISNMIICGQILVNIHFILHRFLLPLFNCCATTLRSLIVVPPRLLIFENFSDPPFLLGPPRLLIFANFNFSTCKIFKYTLSIKGILTNFCVREVYSRRKSTKLAYVWA